MIETNNLEHPVRPVDESRSGHLPALASNDIYYFPEGLPGFETVKGFSIQVTPQLEPFFLLDSVSPEGIQFACVDPFLVCPDYDPQVSKDDLEQLQLDTVQEGIFICMVALDPKGIQSTANLRGPLLLSPRHRLARQVDVGRMEYSFKYPLAHVFRYAQHHKGRSFQSTRRSKTSHSSFMAEHQAKR